MIFTILINSSLDQEPFFSVKQKLLNVGGANGFARQWVKDFVLHLLFHAVFGVLSGVRLSTVASQTGCAWERVKIALTLVLDEKLQDNKLGPCWVFVLPSQICSFPFPALMNKSYLGLPVSFALINKQSQAWADLCLWRFSRLRFLMVDFLLLRCPCWAFPWFFLTLWCWL